jgi:vanillate monooxygenase ferredoxin subunit
MSLLSVRVDCKVDEAVDIQSFELCDATGASLPFFTAGAHIDVHIAPGLTRQYSLCGGETNPRSYLIAVKKELASRGGSRTLHESVHEGSLLQISTPRNNFPLNPDARHHVLLAGGIGVTPLISMARHLNTTGGSFELHYFSRSPRHTAFREALSGAEFGARTRFHYALEPAAVRTYLEGRLARQPTDAHLYICGPRPFMGLAESIAAATWRPEAVHVEYFTCDPALACDPRDSFIVKLARLGKEYEVPAHKSITQVLQENGVSIDTSCEQGVCGTCMAGLLQGEPDHRDSFLTDDEKRAGKSVLLCVSRAKSRVLVLDL